MSSTPHAIWLDADPGHDDALALLLALHSPALRLLGVSSVSGNAAGLSTWHNAAKLLAAFGASAEQVPLLRGCDVPLMRTPKAAPSIHGEDGLGGVKGLPELSSPSVQSHLKRTSDGPAPLALVSHLTSLLRTRVEAGEEPLSIVATGPMTNIALLLRMAPSELLLKGVKQIVLMGGNPGVSGNISPAAEFNFLVDPEAARIVCDSPLPVIMAGLNVTHQAIWTRPLHAQLLSLGASPVRDVVSSAMEFFAAAYASQMGFASGPPVHDFLCVAYLLDASLFAPPTPSAANGQADEEAKRYRVEVQTSEGHNLGATVVAFHDQWPIEHEGWAAGGRNVRVLEHLDTERLWPLLFAAIERAEARVASNVSS
ncbi:Inosine/uridine-preferring nucleoside hydrolase [Tilletiopsis washingtonensis]|uniref:Inosine/uridine-preferring nucleoside hydrolase n=1 Tax=Tilletiopsis washingtonensis TaxID=58919 RepID=A0A316ZFV9_9BASI|nr:Inosine/uridine-preferring nucleoside hydrolase [Tilletiopsis washingtonensis]PWO00127.1 Inosine/uridine-preferring nucleoside hydrolase [Tilletiopsis washingtonensis]